MPGRALEGRTLAAQIREHTAARAQALRARNVTPRCEIFIGEGDPEGAYYGDSLRKVGDKVGVAAHITVIPMSEGSGGFVAAVERAAHDGAVHGVLVQRPLPKPFDLGAVSRAIPVDKDVDGASALSLGLLAQGTPCFVPATAAAVVELLRQPGLPALEGAHVVVLGRSAVVGKPVAALLTAADATVTLCHSRTRDLTALCRSADIVVAAIGKPRFVGAAMIKPGATVIDVGTNLVDDKVVGDVDTDAVLQVAGAVSPVPGGVGVVTTSLLLRHVVAAAENANPLPR
jgi:methylenetetrahydrofolate dehydrogenase (NADP+) / methenyltetrahydrofolate cyclohydrolase